MVFEERRMSAEHYAPNSQLFPGVPISVVPTLIPAPAQPEEKWQVRGLRAPVEQAVGDTSATDMDICQPMIPAYEQFLKQKSITPDMAADALPAAPPVAGKTALAKGSTMKSSGSKRQKTVPTASTASTKTSAVEVALPPKPESADKNRGSLRAFITKRIQK